MNPDFKIAVVEDDEWYRKLVMHTIRLNPDYQAEGFEDGKALLKGLDASFDLVTLDYRLPDFKGVELLEKIKEKYPNMPVIIVSEQEEIETAVDLLKAGASDYVVKSENIKRRLLHAINLLQERKTMEHRIETLESEVKRHYDPNGQLVGDSDSMDRIHGWIKKSIKTDINVVITGETGTGKELVAKTIHYNSSFSKGEFVAVNVASIPTELLESELFGHVKGAFTGANQDRIGRFEQANGGTLLLDEIAEMPLPAQAKLLRVLQEKEFVRLGSNKAIPFTARLIAATHKDLSAMVQQGSFRDDLFFRLFGITIELPPLRERGKDIVMLARKFADDYASNQGIAFQGIEKSAVEKLMQYHYPGNVRELKSIVELAVTMMDGDRIQPHDIIFPQVSLDQSLLKSRKSMREYELMILDHYLKKYNGDAREVADVLQIGKSTVYRMMKELELSQNGNNSQND